MRKLLHSHHPFRIFFVSAFITASGLVGVFMGFGLSALITTIILIIIEIIFSFDNAIVNAKILQKLSPFWMMMFLTVGIFIAVFGMRLLFPLLVVALAASMNLLDVWTMALNNPDKYADILLTAHPLIASFGGAFLLLLSLDFFINDEHDILWYKKIESLAKRFKHFWLPAGITLIVLMIVALLAKEHTRQIIEAGLMGMATYLVVQLITRALSRSQPKGSHLTGLAALSLFMYLQVLDASFSFDGVIGAFAITNVVVLIAIGLGIGAFWVRSLTIYLVRKGTLAKYIYLEHGAFYTISMLALSLLTSLFIEVPDILTGGLGILIISMAFWASVKANKKSLKEV